MVLVILLREIRIHRRILRRYVDGKLRDSM